MTCTQLFRYPKGSTISESAWCSAVRRKRLMTFRRPIQGTFIMLAIMAGLVAAQQRTTSSTITRQSMDDARWTGRMLAPLAPTLPRGHFLIEPYLYDVTMQAASTAMACGAADWPTSPFRETEFRVARL